MKLLVVLYVIAFMVYGCRLAATNDDVRAFIPGAYIRYSEHEYGHEYDTLILIPRSKASSDYTIIRRWKYERVIDNTLVEPEYKEVRTSGYYDVRSQLLHENESGNYFSFDIKAKVLFNGATKYQKL